MCSRWPQRLCAADNILILCHKNPDGDTIGCGSALYYALKCAGQDSGGPLLRCSALPLQRLPAPVLFRGDFEPKTVVAVDVASVQLFGENNGDAAVSPATSISASTTTRATAAMRNSPCWTARAAAAAELLYEVICAMGVELTPLIANCLYTGLCHRHRLLPVLFHHGQHPPRGGQAHGGRARRWKS